MRRKFMTNTNQNPSASVVEHLASGSLPKRALKVIMERLAQKSGEKLASSALTESVFGAVTRAIGTEIPDVVFERAGDIAAIFLQDPGLWRALTGTLGLSADQAQELTNEGLDKFLTGYFDTVREMKGKTGKDLDTALRTEADLAIDRMSGHLAGKCKHAAKKVWFDRARGIAHEVGCDMVQYKKNVDRGTGNAGIPFAEVFSRGGRMALDCDCIGARDAFRGNLQDALAECHATVQEAFNQMLSASEVKPHSAKIMEAGNKRHDLMPSHLLEIVDRCNDPATGLPNRALQKDKLLALVGIQTAAPATEPSRLKKLLGTLGERAAGAIETLVAPHDAPARQQLRQRIEDDTKAVRNKVAKHRGLFGKK